MRDSIYRITLDIYNIASQVQIVAKKGDSARRIYATLTEHGQPFVVPFGCRALMGLKRPGREDLIADCDIRSDGTIIYDFTALTADAAGLVECELTVYDADNSLLASPNFTIFVTDSTFEEGQTLGAAWQKAIDKAAAQIKETTDALEEKTISMPRTYGTAADFASEPLKKGQMVATRGRWQENDGGDRTYCVTDAAGATLADNTVNPLAIPIENEALEETLYAIPVITDCVTAYDIGLRTGRATAADIAEEPTVPGETDSEKVSRISRMDGKIPAENSRLLQNYINHMPQAGATPDVPTAQDYWAGGKALNRIFFPSGQWFFRDPVVLKYPVTLCGTASQVMRNFSRTFSPTRPASRLWLLEAEFTVGDGVSRAPGFAGIDDTVNVVLQDESKTGDEEQDLLTGDAVESQYVPHALFYAAANGIVFEDLEIGSNAFTFRNWAAANNNSWMYKPDRGGPFNIFHITRRQKGVCGVICQSPNLDGDGSILVKANGSVSAAGVSTYTRFDRCSFMGFSECAVRTGKLTTITNCHFAENYVGIAGGGADTYLYDTYIQMGLAGIATGAHTFEAHSCWIDLMAGIGVYGGSLLPSRVQVKHLETVGTGSNAYTHCVHSGFRFGAELIGHYDIVMDYCVYGAYLAQYIKTGVMISGKISHCGTLYTHEARIARQTDFPSQTTFLKAKDYVDRETALEGHTDYKWSGSAWTANGTGSESDQTLAQFLALTTDYVAIYRTYAAAAIQLHAPTAAWYNGVPDTPDVSDDEWNAYYLEWLRTHATAIDVGDDGQPIYSEEDMAAAADATDEHFRSGSEPASLARAARIDNFGKLLGTAAVNIALCYMLASDAEIGVRYTAISSSANVVTPVYGYNVIAIYDSVITNVNPRARAKESSTLGRYAMEPIEIQGEHAGLTMAIPRQSGKDRTQRLYSGAQDERKKIAIELKHDAGGRPLFFASGDVDQTAGVNIETTSADNAAIAEFELYPAFYEGPSQTNWMFPMFAAADYNDGQSDAVKTGDLIGLLILNFAARRVRVIPYKTYVGLICPISR